MNNYRLFQRTDVEALLDEQNPESPIPCGKRNSMAQLEDITKDTTVKGILANSAVKIIDAKPIGSNALKVVYKGPDGATDQEILFRDRESTLEVVESGRPWSFTGDGNRSFGSSLKRFEFDSRICSIPYSPSTHHSVEPLPHQITAVYEEMLTRQPLRFLLADDPGAGKTIMAGLLIKELLIRGDLKRCMIVAPGNLVEQWQDELSEKFQLPFEIMTNDKFESAYSGNWFLENDSGHLPTRQAQSKRNGAGQIAASPIGTSSSLTKPTRCRRHYLAAKSRKRSDTSWADFCRR